MKTHIALALWLATGSCAWAAENDVTHAGDSKAPVGWSMGAGTPVSAVRGAPVQPQSAASTNGNGQLAADSAPPSLNDVLPPHSPLFEQAQERVSPVTAKEARDLLLQQQDMDRALSTSTIAVIPKISALTVDLSPGASLPLVRTAVNYPSSLTFIDSTGSPWKLGAAPISGNPEITVMWVPNSPVMVISASRSFVSGNVTVYLDGLPVPIMLNVTSGEPDSKATTWTVDSRLDMRMPRRGPAALAGAAPESRIGLHDSILQTFLDGIPPKEAKRLKTTGNVPETTVWQLGDDLYIRSPSEIRDEFEATLSSADGTHLWKLPVTPYVTFSVMGRTSALNVSLE